MKRKSKKRIVCERWAMLVCAGAFTAWAVWGVATINSKAKEFEAAYEASKTAAVQTVTVVKHTPTANPVPVLYNVPLSEDLQEYIIEQCESKGIDPAIVLAMIEKESCFTADAIGDNGNSYGLMQIQPKWHYQRMSDLGCTDLLDPYQNVTVGIDLLADLLERNGGDYGKALTCYNQGSFKGTVSNYANAVLATADELRGESA